MLALLHLVTITTITTARQSVLFGYAFSARRVLLFLLFSFSPLLVLPFLSSLPSSFCLTFTSKVNRLTLQILTADVYRPYQVSGIFHLITFLCVAVYIPPPILGTFRTRFSESAITSLIHTRTHTVLYSVVDDRVL